MINPLSYKNWGWGDCGFDMEGKEDGRVRCAENPLHEGDERQDHTVQKLILAPKICYVVAGPVGRVLGVAQILQ